MSDTIATDDALELLDLPRSERVSRLFGLDPYPYEADVLDDETPRKCLRWGRQTGKTETAGAIPAEWALTHPGEDVLVCARFQEQADELFRRTKKHLDALGDPGEVGVDAPNKTSYEFTTGGRILSRTLATAATDGSDEKGSSERGKTPSCIVVEEAALVERNTYDRVLRPMVATHDDFELVLLSTPRGQQGYFYQKCTDDPRWSESHVPTSANPDVSEEWLSAERADVDEITWRTEYLAEFLPTNSDPYLPFELVRSAVGDPSAREADVPRWLGVDPAGSGDDRSGYVSVSESGDVRVEASIETETTPEALGRIKALDRKQGGYEEILVDKTGLGTGVFDFASEDLSNVRPMTFSLSEQEEMWPTLKRLLEQGDLTLPDHERLTHELTALTYSYSRSGKLRVEHPPGGHDDHADALAAAVFGREDANVSASNVPHLSAKSPARVLHTRSPGSSRSSGSYSRFTPVPKRDPDIYDEDSSSGRFDYNTPSR